MMYKLDNRWIISSDKYNFILTETTIPATGKPYTKNRYFSTLEQISDTIISAVAKDSLSRQSITRDKNTPTIKRIELLMGEITQDLTIFIQGLTNNEKA